MRPYLRVANVFEDRIDLSDVMEMNFSPEEFETYCLHPGDILLNEGQSPELVGRPALYRGELPGACFTNSLVRFKCGPAVLPAFAIFLFRHWLRTGQFRRAAPITTNIAHLGAKRFAEMTMPLPPLAEQRRIADKLDDLLARVDACRDRLDRVPGILKRFRQAVLAAATSGELTRDWRDKHGIPGQVAEFQIGDETLEVPDSWQRAGLRELLDPARPLCYGVVQPGDEVAGGVVLVRVQDLGNGTVQTGDLRTISAAVDQEYKRSRVREGDILVSIVGTIGRVAIVPQDFEGNIARALARLACGPHVTPAWIRYWLESSVVQWWLLNSSREVARKTLNLSELAETPVAVPSREEQAEIVRRVEELFAMVERIERSVEVGSDRLAQVTPTVLAKALRGEMVPQDPNDEPASVLLDRIRAERAASGPAPKKRGRTPKVAVRADF
jgi:type I restriction enzyme S subunit